MDVRKILLIDDDRLQQRIVQQMFKSFHGTSYALEAVATFEDGVAALLNDHYDACLLDYQLGRRDGLELLAEVRESGNQTPVIFLTAETSAEVDQRALDGGAIDYLVKSDLTPAMLERSLRYAIRLGDTLTELRQLATKDALTGVFNRREFDRQLSEEFSRAVRFSRPLVLGMIDLDQFKQVNDQYGHPAGDAVIREMVRRVSLLLSSADRLYRIGGDEFALLLIETKKAQAAKLAESILNAIRGDAFELGPDLGIRLSASLGFTELTRDFTSPEMLRKAADQALYVAKTGGRDRVEVI